jgi:uncharacterized protein (TIGR03067 family)
MPSPCPSTELLRNLLDGSLPELATAELTQHLDACGDCRAVLDRLAGDESSISAGARGLAQPPTEPERGLERVLRDADRHADSGVSEVVTQAPDTPGGVPAQTGAVLPQPDHRAAPEASGSQTDDFAFLAALTTPTRPDRLGHYVLKGVLGKGGFGVVLKAFDEKLHRMVAIKVLAPAYAAVGSARTRFVREARSAAIVKNEHVVAIYGVQDETEPPYIVMELIDGISLQDKLDKHGPLSAKEVLRIGLQLAEGLAAAHKQGLVHRDIKPANVLLENGVERIKITDFGLARAVDDASLTQSGTVAGTPMYMSPEQARGDTIDHRSDLFSLGTVLYAMCTGHPPFRATGTHAVLMRVIEDTPRPIREINNEIPEWLEAIVGMLHAKKRAERFQTAKEVAELLGQHLAHLQQPTTVPLPAPVVVARGAKAADGEGAAADDLVGRLFAARVMPRDGADLALALLLTPIVIGLYWIGPSLVLYLALTWLGLGRLAEVLSGFGGFAFFVGVLLVAAWFASNAAIVSGRGIELIRYAGSSTFVPWGKIRRIQEATRWEVFRRVWIWPGIPLRGSIMCSSARYQFRIEWDDTCYYFGPQDHAAFRKAVAHFQPHAEKDTTARLGSQQSDLRAGRQVEWQAESRTAPGDASDKTRPRVRPGSARRRWALAAAALAALLCVPAMVYFTFGTYLELLYADVGLVSFDEFNPEFEEFHIRTSDPEPPPQRVKAQQSVRLRPGQYHVHAIGRGGETVARWRLASSGLFSGFATTRDARTITIDVSRGDRIWLSIEKWVPAPIANRDGKAPDPPARPDDKERLQGHWVAESVDNGDQIPKGKQPKELTDEITLTIVGNKLTMRVVPLDANDKEDLEIHLDETANPKKINLIDADRKTAFGIYRFDGDRLMLCLGGAEVKDRPTEFSATDGNGRWLGVFKRAKAAEDAGWVQLFNGKDLTGWVPQMRRGKLENSFTILGDGVLLALGMVEGEGVGLVPGTTGYLRTEKAFEDFILELECRSHANDPYNRSIGGLLFQIMLNDPPPRNQDTPSGATDLDISPGSTDGSLRANAAADFKLLKTNIDWRGFKIGGEWNQLRVEAATGKFVVTLNGKQVVGLSDFPKGKGPIGVLAHGTGMQYRNIRIKELPRALPALPKKAAQLKARHTLGGRMIATEETGLPGHEDLYWLLTYDTNLSAYRSWLFNGAGEVMSGTLKCNEARPDGSTAASTWKRINPDRWNWTMLSRDAIGKTLFDIQPTKIRTKRICM